MSCFRFLSFTLDISYKSVERILERIFERILERIRERIFERIRERIFERIFERVFRRYHIPFISSISIVAIKQQSI